MPMYNKSGIAAEASKHGFQRDVFEKVLRLKTVLDYFQEEPALREHLLLKGEPALREHLLLKGGTAINLTVFSLPRLSVDIDMDYMPNDSKENMMATRGKISKVVKEYMESEGYQLSDNSRFSHSLDAFHFLYMNSGGNRDMIKIELNYSLRAHVLHPTRRELLTDAFGDKSCLYTVHPIEIFAAKANALLSRAAARDLYDFNNLVTSDLFQNSENNKRLSLNEAAAFLSDL